MSTRLCSLVEYGELFLLVQSGTSDAQEQFGLDDRSPISGIQTQDCWMKVKRLINGATGWLGARKVIQLQQFLVYLLVKPMGDPPCKGSRVVRIDPSPFPGRMS